MNDTRKIKKSPIAVATPGIFISGAIAQEVWGTKVPQWVQNKAPVGGPETETICRHCLQILTAETTTILKIPHNSPRLLTTVGEGAKATFCGELSHKPMPDAAIAYKCLV